MANATLPAVVEALRTEIAETLNEKRFGGYSLDEWRHRAGRWLTLLAGLRSEPPLVQRVAQRANWDCAFACVAMVAGVTLDEAIAAAPPSLVEQAKDVGPMRGGVPSSWIPNMLGSWGIACLSTFERGEHWSRETTGLRIVSTEGHNIVVLWDNTVLDPAREMPKPIAEYGKPVNLWEIVYLAAPPGTRDAPGVSVERDAMISAMYAAGLRTGVPLFAGDRGKRHTVEEVATFLEDLRP